MSSIIQLRMLIRIDECRLAHYQQMIDHATDESDAAAVACARELRERWSLCLQRLQFRRARLEYLRAVSISPAAPFLGHVAPSSDAVKSVNPS